MGNRFGVFDSKHHDTDLHAHDELVVFGYIREQTMILNQLIPFEIQTLCSQFYYQACYLFLTIGSRGSRAHNLRSIKCINLKSFERFDFRITDITNNEVNILETQDWDKMFYGECIQHDVLLPPWILNQPTTYNVVGNLDPYRRYNILYRMAGAASKNFQLTNTCHAMLYASDDLRQRTNGNDKGVINAFYYTMPELSQRLTSVTSILDEQRNCIYTVGRNDSYGNNIIHELDLNAAVLEWKQHKDIIQSGRIFGVALAIIDDAVILMCGGRDIASPNVDAVHIINLNTKQVIDMDAMNHKRAYFDCVPYRDNREFIVGGGYVGCKTLEILDVVKDKWRIVPQETKHTHEWKSCLFMDNCNENIVYIGGQQLGYDEVAKLGTIEWCDLRENTNKFQMLRDYSSIASLFDINKNFVIETWKSRSLLM
eukprot:240116_1